MDSGCRLFYFCVKVFEAILTKPILPLKQNYLNSKIIICAIRELKSSDECVIWAFPRSQLNRFLANFMHNMFGLPQPIFYGNSVVLVGPLWGICPHSVEMEKKRGRISNPRPLDHQASNEATAQILLRSKSAKRLKLCCTSCPIYEWLRTQPLVNFTTTQLLLSQAVLIISPPPHLCGSPLSGVKMVQVASSTRNSFQEVPK